MALISRLLVLVASSCVVLAALAGPALAHGRGSDATSFRSRITAPPDLPGITWDVVPSGEFLSVTNTTDKELVIIGYDGPQDQYLRIGPDGVFRNANSTATYLNQTSLAQDAPTPPATANPDAEPDWVKLSDGNAYSWTDHRIHWESPTPPEAYLRATETIHVLDWNGGEGVPVRYDGQDHVVEGVVEWVPAPSPWPFVAIGIVLTLPALLGLRAGSDATAPDWVRRAARPAAVVLGVVALLNLLQLYDDFFALPLPLGQTALKGLQTALFIVIGLFGAVRAWQGRDGAFAALGVGAIAIFVGQGLLYWTTLLSSQTTSEFPDIVSRVVVALSLGQLLSVGLVSLWGSNRIAKTAVEPTPAVADAPPA